MKQRSQVLEEKYGFPFGEEESSYADNTSSRRKKRKNHVNVNLSTKGSKKMHPFSDVPPKVTMFLKVSRLRY